MLPPELVAVSAYTVELPGVIAVDPLAATLPIPGWMFTEVALDTLQLKVDEPPAETLLGDALNELIVGADVADGVEGVVGVLVPGIITCVVAIVLPDEFEAVSVYKVLVVGAIALVPLTATFPIPLSRLTLVAPVTLQLSVELSPDVIVDGLALNEFTTGFSAGAVVAGVVVAGFAGIYMHPHVKTRIETITKNSLFIFLPYIQV
jgi:hypothetical protein